MESKNGDSRVAVPSHYYKVILRKESGQWHSIAFLIQNNNDAHGHKWEDVKPDITQSIVTLEKIESHANITIHPNLDRSEIVQGTSSDWDFSKAPGNLEFGCR